MGFQKKIAHGRSIRQSDFSFGLCPSRKSDTLWKHSRAFVFLPDNPFDFPLFIPAICLSYRLSGFRPDRVRIYIYTVFLGKYMGKS